MPLCPADARQNAHLYSVVTRPASVCAQALPRHRRPTGSVAELVRRLERVLGMSGGLHPPEPNPPHPGDGSVSRVHAEWRNAT